jgi:hypothetical protein
VRPERLGQFKKNPPHQDFTPRPSGLQHSALTHYATACPLSQSRSFVFFLYKAKDLSARTRNFERVGAEVTLESQFTRLLSGLRYFIVFLSLFRQIWGRTSVTPQPFPSRCFRIIKFSYYSMLHVLKCFRSRKLQRRQITDQTRRKFTLCFLVTAQLIKCC